MMIYARFSCHQEPRWWPLRTTPAEKDLEEIRHILRDYYKEVQRGRESVRLELADHKTEGVLFTSQTKVETITLDVGQCTITSQPNNMYLRVMLDTRLNFKAHLQYAAAKAVRAALMPNIGGPSVVTSILTYGIAIWGKALKIEKYRRKMAAVNWLRALSVSSAFRTVSDDDRT